MPKNLAASDRPSVVPLSATVWALRTLVLAFIVFLCVAASSLSPAFAFAVAWGPSVLFALAFLSGALRFPALLNSVHPIEPVLYRWLGVGLVKRLVATRVWPAFVGVVPPPNPTNRSDFVDRIEHSTQGAEISHWPTLVLASGIALLCLVAGRGSVAAWILVFNVLLNAYPIMLQRLNRWRLQEIRANPRLRGSRESIDKR
jgi:hypothetical protein